jgi:dynactin complex subunit
MQHAKAITTAQSLSFQLHIMAAFEKNLRRFTCAAYTVCTCMYILQISRTNLGVSEVSKVHKTILTFISSSITIIFFLSSLPFAKGLITLKKIYNCATLPQVG